MNESGEILQPRRQEARLGSPLWNAKTLAHRFKGYSGNVDGWGNSSMKAFAGTSFEMDIPVKRRGTRKEVMDELGDISSESLAKEDFPDFYKHVDMLLSFDTARGIEDTRAFQSRPVIEASIGTIIERIASEAPKFAQDVYPHDAALQRTVAFDCNLRMLACLEMASENPSFRLEDKFTDELYRAATESGHPTFLPYALFFDERNKMYSKGQGLQEQFEQFALPKLLSTDEKNSDVSTYLPNFLLGAESLYSDLLTYTLLRADTDDQIVSVIQKLAPQMGVERMRKRLREYVGDNPSFQPKFDTAFTYLGFDPKEPQVSLADVYTKIDFASYKPNEENQQFEKDLLLRELEGKQEVLDIACGTGRLIDAIDGQAEHHVSGIDMMPKHIAAIKERDPQKDVHTGSWFSMPFADKQFDAAYCLGRSAMHNTTVPDVLTFFKEAKRVIKDDGFVIMDFPDPTKGEYKEHVEQTKNIVAEKGLKNVLPGLITDSPDLEHFYDRYVPDERALRALAFLSGFHAEKIVTNDYHNVSGAEESNVYWKFTKTASVPEDAYFLLLGDIYQGNYSLTI